MEKIIKTREHVKDIKVLDKSVVAAQHMKNALVQTKEKSASGSSTDENSPTEYATDHVSAQANQGAKKVVQSFDKQGRQAVQATKENVRILQKKFKEKEIVSAKPHAPKHHVPSAAPKSPPIASSRQLKQGQIKIRERTPLRQTKKTIKTAEQATKAAAKSAQTTVKASQRATKAARITAKKAASTAKTSVKVTISAIKGILLATKNLLTALIAGGWISVLIILIMVLFGSALALFGGGNSNTTTPVSAEVQAYEPLIRKYATEHGIPAYVELIKAVMMQESAGRGLDPMQASESAFNTRYPRQPNGITDPDYSISCGVQAVKSVLVQAEVQTPIDMERIKLALQGYNFGNGYIPWAINKDGGYTPSNAVEFSDMMAQRLGWSNYGDKQYVPHVLRYYPFGRTPGGTGNQAIVQIALSQVGNVGGQPYWSWYGFSGRVEWCACFVSWCANEAGYIESGTIPKFAGCMQGANWFKERGQWEDRNTTPEPGTIIFFDWEGDGISDHVGIVERVEDGTVYTVEGNSSDACRQRNYNIGSSVIYGYGVPVYE